MADLNENKLNILDHAQTMFPTNGKPDKPTKPGETEYVLKRCWTDEKIANTVKLAFKAACGILSGTRFNRDPIRMDGIVQRAIFRETFVTSKDGVRCQNCYHNFRNGDHVMTKVEYGSHVFMCCTPCFGLVMFIETMALLGIDKQIEFKMPANSTYAPACMSCYDPLSGHCVMKITQDASTGFKEIEYAYHSSCVFLDSVFLPKLAEQGLDKTHIVSIPKEIASLASCQVCRKEISGDAAVTLYKSAYIAGRYILDVCVCVDCYKLLPSWRLRARPW